MIGSILYSTRSYTSLAANPDSLAASRSLYSRMDAVEQKVDVIISMLKALCVQQGVSTASIPGYVDLPPLRRSPSPGMQPASPQVPLSSLNISDSHSNEASASDQPGVF